jgi:hypothetical protein
MLGRAVQIVYDYIVSFPLNIVLFGDAVMSLAVVNVGISNLPK